MRTTARLLLRVMALSALLSLFNGCTSVTDHKSATTLSNTETLVLGRVLVYEEGTLVAKRPLVFLTPSNFQLKHGVTLWHPDDWLALATGDDDGYFWMVAPLGTYGLLIQYELRRPLPQGHAKEWLRVSPAVSVSLTTVQSVAYIGTLKIDLVQVPSDQGKEVEPLYTVTNTEVIDDGANANAEFLRKHAQDGSLPQVTSLLDRSQSVRPAVDFLFVQQEYRIPWEVIREIIFGPPMFHP